MNSSLPVFVGLDYHRRSIQVCVMDASGQVLTNRKCPSEVDAVVSVVQPLGQVQRLAIESSTGAAEFAQGLVDVAGWNVSLAHPGYVRRMKTNRDKSDRSDAWIIADLVRMGYVPRVWLAPPRIRDLRTLVHHRDQLVSRRRGLKTRVVAVLRDRRIREAPARRWTKRWIAWLETTETLGDEPRWVVNELLSELESVSGKIDAVERRLAAVTADDPVVAKLLTLPGIGPVTAWMLRAIVGRFDRFATGKQLARFIGLTPRNASSGERMADAGIIHAGHPSLKGVIIQAAHRLKRHHPRWASLFCRLVSQGKPKNVATSAIANRWIRSLHHEMVETAG